MSLRRQTASGFRWTAASQAGRQGMQLLTIAVLAHLLQPTDFGLIAMATVATGFITLFRDLGTSAALIQRRELSDRLVASLFWVNAGFGLLAAALLALAAPLIALFYHEPRVTPVLQVLALSFVASGLGILHQALLERRLAFARLARVELAATLAGALVGIGMALRGWGVWSLVGQSLAVATLTTILLWAVTGWRPALCFDWSEVRSVSRYSLNLTGYNIFNYFARNADYLLVGRFLGAADLGFYTLAYRIMFYPLQNVSAMVGRVMFPVYARLQDDAERFRNAFLKIAGGVALLTFPLMLGVLALARPFVLGVFGPRWEPTVLLLQILAPAGMIQTIVTLGGSIYQARGRTDWMFRWGVFAGTVFVAAFALGVRWGVTGVAAAFTAALLLLSYPALAIPLRLIGLRVGRLARTLLPPLTSALLMFGGLLAVLRLLPGGLDPRLTLLATVPFGVAVFALCSWRLDRGRYRELYELLRSSG